MRPRSAIPAAEVPDLHARLALRLDREGLATQPEVAGKLLELVENTRTGVGEIARHLRIDPALSGRVLRLANSAYFAQCREVTEIEHASVLLGFERLKRIAMSFYVDRGSEDARAERIARTGWSSGVFRGLLSAEIATSSFPGLSRSSFVVGVMLDAGAPLMHRLLGDAYLNLLDENDSPLQQYTAEYEKLPFTHVDIAAVLARRWRLPNDITKPIVWQHTKPIGRLTNDPSRVLHRLAHTVGELTISAEPARDPLPATTPFKRMLDLDPGTVRDAFRRAQDEYTRVMDELAESAERLGSLEAIHQSIHLSLAREVDNAVQHSLEAEHNADRVELTFDDQIIRFQRENDLVAGYLLDHRGQPLACYRFFPHEETAGSLCEAFLLDATNEPTRNRLSTMLRQFAA